MRSRAAPWGRVSDTGVYTGGSIHIGGDLRLRDASWLPGEAFGGEEQSLKCRSAKGQVFFLFFWEVAEESRCQRGKGRESPAELGTCWLALVLISGIRR